MPILATAAVTAGASIYGASQQSNAAKKSAQASQQATDATIAEQRRQYDTTRADNMPWHDAGVGALGQISNPANVLSHFQASPDYQFRLDQGTRAVNQNRATSGLLRSGSALKALSDYAQNTASGEFGNWWNRQAGLAGVGQAANAANQSAGQNSANNIGNALTNNANNLASSYGTQGAASAQMAGNLAGTAAWGINNWMKPSNSRTFGASVNGIGSQAAGIWGG